MIRELRLASAVLGAATASWQAGECVKQPSLETRKRARALATESRPYVQSSLTSRRHWPIQYRTLIYRAGPKVGEESSICTITRVEANGASTVHCTGVQSLPGGQVTTEGTINYGPNEFPKADPYSLAIKGGTGKYRTAHGEIRIQELTNDEWQNTLRIIL